MTAIASSFQSHSGSSLPPSTSSSPSSPTFHFPSIRNAPNGVTHNLRPSRPATPVLNGVSESLDLPPGMTYAEFVRCWTDTHVANWLLDIKCAHHVSTFKDNDIRGDIILELDQTTLKEMGVVSIGDRLRLLNAVKSLRAKCVSHHSPTIPSSSPKVTINGAEPIRLDTSVSGLQPAGGSSESSPPPMSGISPNTRQHRRLGSGRPAPLQLDTNPAGQDLPRLVQGPDSARPNPPPSRPLPSQPSQPGVFPSAPLPAHSRSNLPPLPPPPRSQPPLPPSNISRTPVRGSENLQIPAYNTGRRTPTRSDTGSSLASHHSSSSQSVSTPVSANWTGYGLPSDPRPGNVGGGKAPGRSHSPHHFISGPRAQGGQRLPASPAHGKNGSFSGLPTPTSAPANANKSTPLRPSNFQTLQPPPSNAQLALSPIAESFMSQQSTVSTSSSPPTGGSGYSVGRGPFNRPATPSHSASPSLDLLLQRLVKFFLPSEGKSATIDVTKCSGGVEVMEKVLKKFGKMPASRDGDPIVDLVESDENGLTIDGWGVYLDWGHGTDSDKILTEAEILSICHAGPEDPARNHGLTLVHNASFRNRSDSSSSIVPDGGSQNLTTSRSALTGRDLKRASTISVLSGLGVPDVEQALETPTTPSTIAPLNPSLSRNRPGTLSNFRGQRPPSEMITNHLTEFFPFTEKKVLERTARNSIRRSRMPSNRWRESTASFNTTSRFSMSSRGSGQRMSMSISRPSSPSKQRSSPPASVISVSGTEEPPRLSLSTEDGRSVSLDQDRDHLLPPVPFPTSESLSESIDNATGGRFSRVPSMSKRMSYITELRSKRDMSDSASMITVDEVIAEVENRRKSMTVPPLPRSDEDTEDFTMVEGEDAQEDTDVKPTRRLTLKLDDDQEIVIEGGAVDDDNDEDDNDEDDGGEDTLADDDASPTENAIKWIKGALIGAGSFGSVYLGMDAMSGFLMAVKQVELPTGTGPNEERKKSMLTALEREIELLKGLQHDNIVQYLHSSTDETHLNIFLEYVPGGSVTTLLRNYGAFEEGLVRNFIRQTLNGLNYLHERDIIHRDIKGANILVDNKGGIKISDFGISKRVETNNLLNRAHRPSLQGSVFWMAPEVVKQTAYTRKADIWSVGCLIVEMLTGEHPWAQLTQMQAIFKIGSSANCTPTIPPEISTDCEDFLHRTFELNHEARPSAPELLQLAWIAKDPSAMIKMGKPAKPSFPTVE